MHVAEWSSKLNRPFINRYDKYWWQQLIILY
jgi:hypothetical protein